MTVRLTRSAPAPKTLIETAMQHLVLTTDTSPQLERFSYWREAVAEIGIPGERDRAPETGFEGRLAVVGVTPRHWER